jgi:hypothetical protein
MTAGSAVYMSDAMGFLPAVPGNGPVQFWLAKLELLLEKELAELLDKLIRLDDEFDEELLFDELLEDELLFDELLDEEILLKTLLTEELERITIIEDDDSEFLLDELLLDLLLEMIVSLLELILALLELVSALLLARLAAIDEDNTLLEVLDSSVL